MLKEEANPPINVRFWFHAELSGYFTSSGKSKSRFSAKKGRWNRHWTAWFLAGTNVLHINSNNSARGKERSTNKVQTIQDPNQCGSYARTRSNYWSHNSCKAEAFYAAHRVDCETCGEFLCLGGSVESDEVAKDMVLLLNWPRHGRLGLVVDTDVHVVMNQRNGVYTFHLSGKAVARQKVKAVWTPRNNALPLTVNNNIERWFKAKQSNVGH